MSPERKRWVRTACALAAFAAMVAAVGQAVIEFGQQAGAGPTAQRSFSVVLLAAAAVIVLAARRARRHLGGATPPLPPRAAPAFFPLPDNSGTYCWLQDGSICYLASTGSVPPAVLSGAQAAAAAAYIRTALGGAPTTDPQ